jgi:hypothetical protein
MGKKHVTEHNEQNQTNQESESPVEGADNSTERSAENVEQGATSEEQSALPEVQQQEPAVPEVVKQPETHKFGIGEFARYLILKTDKNNAEILATVQKVFPNAQTTPACIAWYKTDLRKKGLLAASEKRGSTKTIQLSEEQLAQLIK